MDPLKGRRRAGASKLDARLSSSGENRATMICAVQESYDS